MSSTHGKYCLKWYEFQRNLSASLEDFREKLDFTDVTLICDDNQRINAHRIILSTGSPFFQNILKTISNSNIIIYMKGVRAINLKAVVNFIYQGETSVNQDDLKDFLALAEDLQLKGITNNKTENKDEHIEGDIKEEKLDTNKDETDLPTTNLDYTENNLFENSNVPSADAGLLETSEAEALDNKMIGMMHKINESRQYGSAIYVVEYPKINIT